MSSTYIKIVVNKDAKVDDCIKLCQELNDLLKHTGMIKNISMKREEEPRAMSLSDMRCFATIN